MIAAQTHLLHSQTASATRHNGIQVKYGSDQPEIAGLILLWL